MAVTTNRGFGWPALSSQAATLVPGSGAVDPAQQSDLELIRGVVEGRQRAEHEFARRMLAHARRLVSALVRDGQQREDAVQASLLELLRAAGSFRGDSALEHWAQRIIVRTTLRHVRRERWYRASFQGQGPALEPTVPERRRADRLPRAIEAYLDRLPEPQKTAVVLRHALDYSLAEIAELCATSVGTVKARLLHGRRKLRRLVRRDQRIGVRGEGGP